MIIRLDGDLAGEFATRLDDRAAWASAADAGRRRSSAACSGRSRCNFNVTITGPFRALIADRQVVQGSAPADRRRAPAAARRRSRDHHRGPPRRRTAAQTADAGERAGHTPPHHPPPSERKDDQACTLPPALLAAALLAAPLSSCISVKAPDKPIEINLNVTIRQEVLVRLQRDVEQLINQNPQAFPQQQAEAMRELVCLRRLLLALRRPRRRRPQSMRRARPGCRRALRRLSRRCRPGVAGGARARSLDQYPAPLALQQPGREQGRQPAGRRHHRRLPAAGAGRRRRGLYVARRHVAAARAGPGRAGPALLPLIHGLPRLTI